MLQRLPGRFVDGDGKFVPRLFKFPSHAPAAAGGFQRCSSLDFRACGYPRAAHPDKYAPVRRQNCTGRVFVFTKGGDIGVWVGDIKSCRASAQVRHDMAIKQRAELEHHHHVLVPNPAAGKLLATSPQLRIDLNSKLFQLACNVLLEAPGLATATRLLVQASQTIA